MLLQDAYARMCFSVRKMMPCQLVGVHHSVNLIDEQTLELILFAMVSLDGPPPPPCCSPAVCVCSAAGYSCSLRLSLSHYLCPSLLPPLSLIYIHMCVLL